jgi:ribosomal protein L37AE/L43A
MEDVNIAETGDKQTCPFCARTDVYRAYVDDGSMGDWCPHCQRSIPRIEKPEVIEESPDKKQCPFCGKRVVHQAYTEDGGIGDWCPLCKKSIPRIQKES